MPWLLMLKGPNAGQRFALNRDSTSIGRHPSSDILLTNPAVSRRHAQILRQQELFVIEDLNSRNGTFLNNQPLTGPVPLKDNDQIRICDTMCAFQDTGTLPEEGGVQPDVVIDLHSGSTGVAVAP